MVLNNLFYLNYNFRARAVGIHGDKSQSERDHVLKRKYKFNIALLARINYCGLLNLYFFSF